MVKTNFHESYTQSEIKPPSERSTGLVFGAVAVLVAVLWRSDAIVSSGKRLSLSFGSDGHPFFRWLYFKALWAVLNA